MASTDLTHTTGNQSSVGEENNVSNDFDKLILSLPREIGCITEYLNFFDGFWCPSIAVQSVNFFQNNFQAKDSDIVVASMPKSGTTWLKALTFAIVNRKHFTSDNNHPLLSNISHELMPFFETSYVDGDQYREIPKIDVSNTILEPRLFATHLPFPSLAKSVKESNCKLIYICRNPFDTFVSYWNFVNKFRLKNSLPTFTLEDSFERYCKGVCLFGPFWHSMLGYLNESIANPHKVLFLKYEDLKENVDFHVKRIAEFVGFPFTLEEENDRVIENIIKLCSFETMKQSDGNKSGKVGGIEKESFFRKGEIGDWKNYLSPSMVEKLSNVIEEKLSETSLSFKMCT